MYGLPQTSLLSKQKLARFLEKGGYFQSSHTPGLWKHASRPIQFTLVVDDCCANYTGKEHAIHIEKALKRHFGDVSTDWEGQLFCGIKLDWD